MMVLCGSLTFMSQPSDAADNIYGTFGPGYVSQNIGFGSMLSLKSEAKPKLIGDYEINSNIRVKSLNKVEYRYDDRQTLTLKDNAIHYTFRIPLW